MNTSDTTNTCANCGKEGSDVTNTCNKCNFVMYCNAACKKKHRKKHKKECEEHLQRAAENIDAELRQIIAEGLQSATVSSSLNEEVKLHDEKQLFKQPPPAEDCPICMIRLPSLVSERTYMPCCGKVVCTGCVHAPVYDNQGNVVPGKTCPFCRTPAPITDEEMIKLYKKRAEMNDSQAIYNIGGFYAGGKWGFSQNHSKAFELYCRAADLGCVDAYYNIASACLDGRGVETDDVKKVIYHYELAAIKGDVDARYFLGLGEEQKTGNMERALKHYMIATEGGYSKALESIKRMYMDGNATKDDYANALRLYQAYIDEVQTDQRVEAAAARSGRNSN